MIVHSVLLEFSVCRIRRVHKSSSNVRATSCTLCEPYNVKVSFTNPSAMNFINFGQKEKSVLITLSHRGMLALNI